VFWFDSEHFAGLAMHVSSAGDTQIEVAAFLSFPFAPPAPFKPEHSGCVCGYMGVRAYR